MKSNDRPYVGVLVDLVKTTQKEGMVVCEVGVWRGDTLFRYAPIVQKNRGNIIAVDWFCGSVGLNHNHEHAHAPQNSCKLKREMLAKIAELGLEDTITVIDQPSEIAHDFIPYESLDICFIDASHRYTDVVNDIENYSLKVKPGGILAGHDYNQAEVAQAVQDTLFGDFEVIEEQVGEAQQATTWVYRRKM